MHLKFDQDTFTDMNWRLNQGSGDVGLTELDLGTIYNNLRYNNLEVYPGPESPSCVSSLTEEPLWKSNHLHQQFTLHLDGILDDKDTDSELMNSDIPTVLGKPYPDAPTEWLMKIRYCSESFMGVTLEIQECPEFGLTVVTKPRDIGTVHRSVDEDVPAEGPYLPSTEVTLRATNSDSLYEFSHWLITENGVLTTTRANIPRTTLYENPTTVTMDLDKTVTAVFSDVAPVGAPKVTIALTDPTTTSVTEGTQLSFTVRRTGSTTSALDVNVGVTETGQMTDSAPTAVTIPANAAEALLLVGTVDDSVDESNSDVTASIGTDATYTVGDPGSAFVTVNDNECEFTVTAGAHGSVSGGGTFDCGTRQDASATPDSGYRFSRWSGASSSTARSITVLLDVDKSVRATFTSEPPEPPDCEFTVTAGTGGTASGGGTFVCGTSQDASATPDSGYRFDGWSGDSSSTSSSITVLLDADKSVHATFEPQCEFRVTAGAHGSVSGGGTFDCGTRQSASATADSGYRFSRWSGDSSSTSSSITVLLDADKSVHATFTPVPPPCTFTVTAGTGGTASGGGTFVCGTSQPASATADSGYRFSRWSGDSSSTSSSITVLLDVDKSVHATFEPQCEFRVTAGAHGSVSGGGTFDCATRQSASATADSGYRFSRWSGDSSSTSSSISVLLNVDKSVHATFSGPWYLLTVRAAQGGSASGSGWYLASDCAAISATPDVGWAFSFWSGPVANQTSASTCVLITGHTTVTARFISGDGQERANAP